MRKPPGARGRPQPQPARRPPPDLVPPDQARPDTRAPAFCPHFGPCGGCSRLDVAYAEELADKERRLREAVGQVAALQGATLEPILAAEHPLFYRTALKVPFGATPRGPVCGFFQPGTHRIVDLHTCLIQHPVLVEVLRATRELVRSCGVPVYQEHIHKGILRHLVARVAPGTDEVLAGLVVRKAGAPQVKRMAWSLYERLRGRGLVGVVENVNAERTNTILGPRTHRLVGRSVLFEEADGLRVRTSLTAFTQVHAAQASRLFAEVKQKLGDFSGRRIADLYAGYAPIGLRLALAGAEVVAVEKNPTATRDGIDAARFHQLDARIRFVTADAAHGLELAARHGPLDAVVMDPPRRGLGPDVIERLRALRVPRIVYVSCNPATLLRDLDLLSDVYAIRAVRPVDLFPRTEHLEVVALLEPRQDG